MLPRGRGVSLRDIQSTCCSPNCELPLVEDLPVPICQKHYWKIAQRVIEDIARNATADLPPSGAMVRELLDNPEYGYFASGIARPWDKPEPKSSVYFLRFSDRLKIGTTTNMRRRLESIPHDEVLLVIDGGVVLEAEMHARFKAHHAHREWFHWNDETKAMVAVLRAADDAQWNVEADTA